MPIPLQQYGNGQQYIVQPVTTVVSPSKTLSHHKKKPRPPRKHPSKLLPLAFSSLHLSITRCRERCMPFWLFRVEGLLFLGCQRVTHLIVAFLLQMQGFAFSACTCWVLFFFPFISFRFLVFLSFFLVARGSCQAQKAKWTEPITIHKLCLMIPQRRLRGRTSRNFADTLPLPPDLPGKTTTASFLTMAHFNTTPQRKKSARNTKMHHTLYFTDRKLTIVLLC